MGRAACYLAAALILGYFAMMAGDETVWRDLTAQNVPQNQGPLPAIVYLIGRAALFVHNTLGASLSMWLFGIAAFISAVCCVQAIAASNKRY